MISADEIPEALEVCYLVWSLTLEETGYQWLYSPVQTNDKINKRRVMTIISTENRYSFILIAYFVQ